MGPLLNVGKGEEHSGGRSKESILAAAYEAILGGIYWDGGYDNARQVVEKHFEQDVNNSSLGHDDYKTRLQEITQLIYQKRPTYSILSETGPSHEKRFRTEIQVGGDVLGSGEGPSKKQSEQEAARMALERLRVQGRKVKKTKKYSTVEKYGENT